MKNIIILAAVLSLPILSAAQKMLNGDKVLISRQVNHDLYLAGGTVTVNAPVLGDLLVAGGTVILNDTVKGDVTIAGGKVTLNGNVLGDVRGIGGEIQVNGAVVEDLVVSGGTITVGKTALINGDASLSAGIAEVNGIVRGNLTCRGGDFRLYGVAERDVDCRGTSILMNGTVRGKSVLAAPAITIGTQAAFYQDVAFWQKNMALDFRHSIKHGEAMYEPSLQISNGKWQYMGFASILFMMWYLAAALVFILLIQYAFGKTMKKAADEAFTHTLRAMGRGILFWIAIPLAALILMLTLIGLPLGFLLIFSYFILLVTASVISSVIIANWVSNRVTLIGEPGYYRWWRF